MTSSSAQYSIVRRNHPAGRLSSSRIIQRMAKTHTMFSEVSWPPSSHSLMTFCDMRRESLAAQWLQNRMIGGVPLGLSLVVGVSCSPVAAATAAAGPS